MNPVSKSLQNSKLTLDTCCSLLSSLADFILTLKDQYDLLEAAAKILLPETEYTEKRKRIKKRFPGQSKSVEDDLNPKETFKKNVFMKILDTIHLNLKKRAELYEEAHELFGFIIKINIPNDILTIKIDALVKEYEEDIDEMLYQEILQLHTFIKNNDPKTELTHLTLYKMIKEKHMGIAFPNTETILRIFLCLMITNCSGETSFSKLKLTKNDLRSTMSQDLLNNLTIMSSNVDKMKSLDYDLKIDEFSLKNCRKKLL